MIVDAIEQVYYKLAVVMGITLIVESRPIGEL